MAEKIIIELDVDADGAVKSLNKVEGEVKDIGTASTKSAKGVGTLKKGLNALNAAAGIIGIIVIAVLALKNAFTSSEEGQNKYNKAMAVLQSVLGNLTDVVAGIADSLVSMFENPMESLSSFGNLIKDNIINRFNGLLELLPELGRAIGLLFEGEWSEAAKVAANATGKVVLGVDDIVGKTQEAIKATGEFIDEIVREAEVATGIADKRALADKKERDLIVARAEANRKIAENREKAADKENVSTEERIRLLTEAGEISEEITRKEIEAARLRFEAIKEENKLSNSNKEALDAEAQAQARLIELETARLQQQKALTAELTTTRREAEAEQKAIDDEILKQKIADEKELQRIKDESTKAEIKAREEKIKADEISSKAAIVLAKAEKDAKIGLADDTLNAIASLSAEGSKIGKAVAIVQASIDTIKGAQSAFAETTGGIVIKSTAAALAIGFGIANIKKIASTKEPNIKRASGVGGASASVPSIAPPQVAAPEFSIAGDDGQSQLADTVSGAQNKPIKTYVLNSEIEDAKAFDRATENAATFGE